jgi:Y_Y_Y domain/Histidine kinase
VAAARSTDGHLWFANTSGVQSIDPANRLTNKIPPLVHIEAIIANRISYSPVPGLQLPAYTRDIEIDYSAPSFVAPQKMVFRYRLNGRDTTWQEPGNRRQALYTDLPPGNYSFQVVAANNDGVWNNLGANASFLILPAWYQTGLFRASCVVLAILILWFAHCVRMWQAAKLLNARFAERTRIARDFHDTLLQTIQASKMLVDAALKNKELERTRAGFEQVSSWLETAVSEARSAVNSLRSRPDETLEESLREALWNVPRPGMDTSFTVSGTVRSLQPRIRDQISHIGREAIRNALQHSSATQLSVDLVYGANLQLSVRDNGIGMSSDIAKHGAPDHFGLLGMRERAANIDGILTVLSAADSGTLVQLNISGKIAFERWRWRWRTTLGGGPRWNWWGVAGLPLTRSGDWKRRM